MLGWKKTLLIKNTCILLSAVLAETLFGQKEHHTEWKKIHNSPKTHNGKDSKISQNIWFFDKKRLLIWFSHIFLYKQTSLLSNLGPKLYIFRSFKNCWIATQVITSNWIPNISHWKLPKKTKVVVVFRIKFGTN